MLDGKWAQNIIIEACPCELVAGNIKCIVDLMRWHLYYNL